MFGSARLYSLESLRALKNFAGQTGRAINAGRMLPGYGIELDRTADDLSLPRAKVRYALQTLEADGLLDFPEPGRAVVAPLDVRELNRVFTVRRAVEPDVFATAARESPRGGFADLHGVSNGFTTVDWNSDEIYDVASQAFTNFIEPFISTYERSLISDMEMRCERSQRIGYRQLQLHYPTDLHSLAVVYQELSDACQMHSPNAGRDIEIKFLDLAEDISRLAFRTASVTPLRSPNRNQA